MNISLTHVKKKPFFLARCLLGVTSLKSSYSIKKPELWASKSDPNY